MSGSAEVRATVDGWKVFLQEKAIQSPTPWWAKRKDTEVMVMRLGTETEKEEYYFPYAAKCGKCDAWNEIRIAKWPGYMRITLPCKCAPKKEGVSDT